MNFSRCVRWVPAAPTCLAFSVRWWWDLPAPWPRRPRLGSATSPWVGLNAVRGGDTNSLEALSPERAFPVSPGLSGRLAEQRELVARTSARLPWLPVCL